MGGFRKAEAGLTIILVLVIVFVFLGWLFNVSQRECKSNKDCSSESYCGSDFSCHQYPNIQKTAAQYNFVWPSVIIGIAIIIAAIIFKWNDIKSRKTNKNHNQKSAEEETSKSYY